MTDTEFLKSLGAVPVFMPVSEVIEALGRRTIDGASANAQTATDFGMHKVAQHMYASKGITSTLALMMSREKFESLPAAAQDAIRKHSGQPFVQRYIEAQGAYVAQQEEALRNSPDFTVVEPSAEDLEKIVATAGQIQAAWEAQNAGNAELLKALRAATAAIPE